MKKQLIKYFGESTFEMAAALAITNLITHDIMTPRNLLLFVAIVLGFSTIVTFIQYLFLKKKHQQ
ncbi:MAG: hypothetical protein J6X79_06580 [Bacteroidales bacterium]|nr:hypothetical protein [Bacteroidales bacterium]